MSCVLRASGPDFEVDSFLKDSSLEPLVVYRRGEPRSPASNPNGLVYQNSGMNVSVSTREFSDLAGQIADAVQFLLRNERELRRLRDFPGLEALQLDFPVEDRDVAVQTDCFPPALTSLLGSMRIDLAISHYPPSGTASS